MGPEHLHFYQAPGHANVAGVCSALLSSKALDDGVRNV